MRKYILIVFFLVTYTQSTAQQVINNILNPTALALRGIAIPAMLFTAYGYKTEESGTIIPDIIKEEKDRLSKWRKTVIGNVNSLNAIAIASRVLIDRINNNRDLILPAQYAPGFKHDLRQFLLLKETTERLEKKVIALAALSTAFIDGQGYYNVACQSLALEYLDVYAELSKIDFKITKLVTFIARFSQLIITN